MMPFISATTSLTIPEATTTYEIPTTAKTKATAMNPTTMNPTTVNPTTVNPTTAKPSMKPNNTTKTVKPKALSPGEFSKTLSYYKQ